MSFRRATSLSCFYIAALITLGGPNSYAQKPDWIPIPELLLEALDKSDTTKLNHAFNRCTALNISLFRLINLDRPEAAKKFSELSDVLFMASSVASFKFAKETGNSNPDTEALGARNVRAVEEFNSLYDKWFDHNFISLGSYFEKDPVAMLEVETCGAMAGYALTFIREFTEQQDSNPPLKPP